MKFFEVETLHGGKLLVSLQAISSLALHAGTISDSGVLRYTNGIGAVHITKASYDALREELLKESGL